jgi:hypothetical protein
MLGISWVAAQMAASQEGLSSMSEWVSEWVSEWESERVSELPDHNFSISLGAVIDEYAAKMDYWLAGENPRSSNKHLFMCIFSTTNIIWSHPGLNRKLRLRWLSYGTSLIIINHTLFTQVLASLITEWKFYFGMQCLRQAKEVANFRITAAGDTQRPYLVL